MMLTGAVHLVISTNNCGNYASCRQDASNTLHVLLVIGGACFLIFLAWAIGQAVAQDRLEKRGTEATARIKEVTAKPGSRKSNSEVAVYLNLEIPRPDGTAFTAEVSAGVPVLEPPKAGWTVPVKYLEYKSSLLPRVEIRGDYAPPAIEPASSASDKPRPADRVPPENAARPAAAAPDRRRLPAVKPPADGDPRRLGGFEVLGRVGSGGMGVVYLGRSRGGLPEGLAGLVARCLARDPADRPGIETVLDALAR